MLKNFPFIKITTINKEEVREKKIYENGKKDGYEKGFSDGLNNRIVKSSSLSQEEYESFIRYLIVNDLEINYSTEISDKNSNGLMIRKKIKNIKFEKL